MIVKENTQINMLACSHQRYTIACEGSRERVTPVGAN